MKMYFAHYLDSGKDDYREHDFITAESPEEAFLLWKKVAYSSGYGWDGMLHLYQLPPIAATALAHPWVADGATDPAMCILGVSEIEVELDEEEVERRSRTEELRRAERG
jgi:hypothetical protein